MSNAIATTKVIGTRRGITEPPAEPCLLVIFGASGDLTRRLLIPALYNLACEGRLTDNFAIVGMARSELTTESFRDKLAGDIREFTTRPTFDQAAWERLAARIHYVPGSYDDPAAFTALAGLLADLDRQLATRGNVLYYLATPPVLFGVIADNLNAAGVDQRLTGWKRIIVEKPFGNDLASALQLNADLLEHWRESQIYRIDHYLGKETVQNLLAFRFSNGIFEPLWNRNHIDHIQFTVAETVGVEGRGRYYERSGVLRDMIQNHMFQMLAYLCMEPPTSFKADAVRNEKAKLLDAVRVMTPAEIRTNAVRGQYGPGRKPDGSEVVAYRDEPDVDPQSHTETFAALRLFIDNWRWEGVPVYLRSGKSLWKRGTEILVQFKKAPEVIYRETPEVEGLESNQLIFHIQPDQGIELRFQAKTPGPTMALQTVNMRFDYRESFETGRGTGYEVLLYNAMNGDSTLFSRSDLVESSWRVVQPILDAWAAAPDTESFPNYRAGGWGPRAGFELIEQDGRHWLELVNRDVLNSVPLFSGCDPTFLHNLSLMLEPRAVAAGATIIEHGAIGREMYVIVRGQAEVLTAAGEVMNSLGEGDFFGETGLLLDQPRAASIRAITPCDLFVLDRADFRRALRQRPQLLQSILDISRARYNLSPDTEQAIAGELAPLLGVPSSRPPTP